jgi:trans-aconitate methyltransferase
MTSQHWEPAAYRAHAGFVAELGRPLLELLQVGSGERVLDLGCGEGALMQELASRGVEVFGVDSSPEQIAAVRARGLQGSVMDGQALGFEGSEERFDAVLSNAALHWMKDLPKVLAGVAQVLRPGGRFVAECGGAGNVEAIRGALVAELDRRGLDGASRVPWAFRSVAEYTEGLERAGFHVDDIVSFARPTPLPGDVVRWIETFGESFTAALSPEQRGDYLEDVRARLEPTLRGADGVWVADYVRIRFVARRKA